MTCLNCQKLKADLETAREEIAAWEAYDIAPRKREPINHDTAAFQFNARRAFRTTPAVGRLLWLLLQTPGEVVQHPDILDAITDEPEDRSPQLVNVRICHLRQALAFAGFRGAIINERGLGYALKPEFAPAIEAAIGTREA